MQNNPLPKTITGIAGEYYVAAELSRRGYMASITLRNNDSVDILACHSNGFKTFAIQVKTSQSLSRSWPLTKKAEDLFSDNLFYVFVNLKPVGEKERPDFYIVPSEKVAEYVRTSHQEWLKRPGRDGQPHKDNNIRNFRDIEGQYLERWELLL